MLSTIKFPIIIAWQVDSIYLFNIIWSMRLKLIWFTNYVGYRSAFPGASVYFCSCEMHLLRLFPFTASRINSLCFRILFTHVWKGLHKPTTRQFSCNRINVRTQSFIIHLICKFFFSCTFCENWHTIFENTFKMLSYIRSWCRCSDSENLQTLNIYRIHADGCDMHKTLSVCSWKTLSVVDTRIYVIYNIKYDKHLYIYV